MKNKLKRLVATLFVSSGVVISPGYATETPEPIIGYLGDNEEAHVTINEKNVLTIKSTGSEQSPLQRAKKIAKTLNKLQYENKLRADRILPSIRGSHFIARVDNEVIFTIDKKMAEVEKTKQSLLTMKWIDNLRSSLGGIPFDYQVSRGLKNYSRGVQYGYASWYGNVFHGRNTASGEVYNMNDYTAAHRSLPLGTPVVVTNLGTGRSILVKVNDRGPFSHPGKRVLDLSRNAFKAIAPLGSGVIKIKMDVLK